METKLEYTKCVPSVTMDDIIQNIKEFIKHYGQKIYLQTF